MLDSIKKTRYSLLLVLAACAPTTTIEQAWTTPTAQAPMHNVVTLFVSNNQTMRHAGEDKLAMDLAQRGVRATPGYQVLGDQFQGGADAAKAQLQTMGYDGVVTMRIVDREKQIDYAPGTFDGYWGTWGGYWGPYAGYGSYAYTYDIYRLETAAYSLKTNQLLWSVLTKSVDPSSARKLLDSTSKIVAGDLTARGLAG
jgi:hypothetical protein